MLSNKKKHLRNFVASYGFLTPHENGNLWQVSTRIFAPNGLSGSDRSDPESHYCHLADFAVTSAGLRHKIVV